MRGLVIAVLLTYAGLVVLISRHWYNIEAVIPDAPICEDEVTTVGDLTANFSWSEFACKDGACVPDLYQDNVRQLARALEQIRLAVHAPIRVHSGWRSKAHNLAADGRPYSEHLFGRAADFSVPGWSGPRVAGAVEALISLGIIPQGGIGTYPGWVHYDIRGTPARWEGDYDVRSK